MTCMLRFFLGCLGGLLGFSLCLGVNPSLTLESKPILLEVRKIWSQAPHNAFTDLVHFQGQWFCVFREGQKHVSPDGKLRIISSSDGQTWAAAALLSSAHADLRDAKLSITPQGQLLLVGAEALHDRSQKSHQTLAWTSNDGVHWSKPTPIGEPDFWLWRVSWHMGHAYGLGYGCKADRSVRLYRSKDGKHFDVLVPRLHDVGYPNESSLVFDGNKAYCLLRRDGSPNSGLLGIAPSPYTQWQWHDLDVRIGGPCMIQLPDGRLVAVVRLYDQKVRTSVCWIDAHQGRLTEALALPSGGDTSYAGLVWHNGLLWISYYSSHEGQSSIYLAKVNLPPLQKQK